LFFQQTPSLYMLMIKKLLVILNTNTMNRFC